MPIGMNKYVPKYEKEENGSLSQPRVKYVILKINLSPMFLCYETNWIRIDNKAC